ncbi:MAG: GerMN domain-containing protein [Oliverpabstia intestinalis]|jgi:germination protein M|uniref:GerMN domain-containing protein n=1 Tax=Oliverpabstia TaxID=2815777 RepID=UPI00240A8897|nr:MULTISPECIES: GerMN domain-containing protein [Oliverpabstia]MCF2541770.1 GerMN domain-containing protein [Blautia producta]MCI7525960.1 GerMN domain-containing protein [Oliverpabstia sp.]MDD6412281.1 GerMN domain-containing protein [Oliverpabstia intestinalis]MDY5790318.1 GerMN domain-containing protein [Oliverpabstia intestinalis]
MKKRKITALVMALVLGTVAFSGCGKKETESKYKIYYVNEEQGEVLAESFVPSEETTQTMLEEMTEKLNKKNAEGHTLLPENIEIQSCVDDDGMIRVDFNQEYHDLNPVDEVLLRASIVKDYVQIPNIYLVTITAEGTPIVDSQGQEIGAMSLDSFLENTGKEIMAYQYKELNLYFTNEEGNQLVPEARQVYYNGNTPIEKVIVEQLLRGPGESGHYATLPSDTRIVGVSVADGIAYVNLGKQFVDEALSVDAQIPIYSIVNSLIDAGNVSQVQISINGDTSLLFKDKVDMNQLFQVNHELEKGGED